MSPNNNDNHESTPEGDRLGAELKSRVCRTVDAMLGGNAEAADASFEYCVSLARDLVTKKRDQTGTKHDTRDLLGELLFSRMRRGMREFMAGEAEPDELRAAEWVMGSIFSTQTLTEFSLALERAILEVSAPRDFSFAGRADFISVEEVLQMLAAGKKDGRVTLENDENRLDIYLFGGRIAFLDPHHLVRRVLPSKDGMTFLEIPADKLAIAEKRRSREGTPILVTLSEQGVFRSEELIEMMRGLGREVLNEFLRDQFSCAFFYRRLDTMPDFVRDFDMCLAVTPILLEASKKIDDWQNMLQAFPDPNAPVIPAPDMLAMIGNLNLGVLEIKLLTQINGSNTPRDLVRLMGLPLHDVYLHLVRFAREGAVESAQPPGAVEDLYMSVEESMKTAFACLDANDDSQAMSGALDKIFGGGDSADGVAGLFGSDTGGDAAKPEDGGDDIGAEFIRSLRDR